MLDTNFECIPAPLWAVADFLSGDLASAGETLGHRVARSRSQLSNAWQGQGGHAFAGAAATLTTAADGFAGVAQSAGVLVEATARVCDRVGAELDSIRVRAGAGGLVLAGGFVHPPRRQPFGEGFETPLWEATEPEALYQELKLRHDRAWTDWAEALERLTSFVQKAAEQYTSFTSGLIGAEYPTYVARSHATRFRRQGEEYRREARILMGELAEAGDEPWGLPGGAERYANFINDMIEVDEHRRAAVGELPHSPSLQALNRVGGPLLTGYDIYSDIEAGESVEQAVVSQGMASLIASGTAAGAGGGAAFFGIGALPGAVLGATVAGVSAYLTNRAVDKHYESQRGTQYPPRSGNLNPTREESRVSKLLGGNGRALPPSIGPAR